MRYQSTLARLAVCALLAVALSLPLKARAATVHHDGPCNGCAYAYGIQNPYWDWYMPGSGLTPPLVDVVMTFCGYHDPLMTLSATGNAPIQFYGPPSGCGTYTERINAPCHGNVYARYYDQYGDSSANTLIWTGGQCN